MAARAAVPGLPVVAGFGIADAAGARRIADAGVDGVVIGSAVIRVAREEGAAGLRRFLGGLVNELERDG